MFIDLSIIINNVVIHIHVAVLCGNICHFLGVGYAGVKLLGCIVIVCLTLKETAKLFAMLAISFYTPTSNVQRFQSPQICNI